jgi:beta-galactosidase
VRINRVESLRPGIAIPAASSNTPAAFDRWREFLVTGPAASVDMTSADGEPMLVSQSRTTYLAGWPNPALLKDLVSRLADRADLATQALPEDIRVRDNGPIRYIFNYGPEPVDISALVGGAPLLLGETMLKSCGVAACEKLRRGEQASRRSGCLNDPPS